MRNEEGGMRNEEGGRRKEEGGRKCISVQGVSEGERVRVRESARGVRETCTLQSLRYTSLGTVHQYTRKKKPYN